MGGGGGGVGGGGGGGGCDVSINGLFTRVLGFVYAVVVFQIIRQIMRRGRIRNVKTF